jgi:hypothetical protein
MILDWSYSRKKSSGVMVEYTGFAPQSTGRDSAPFRRRIDANMKFPQGGKPGWRFKPVPIDIFGRHAAFT